MTDWLEESLAEARRGEGPFIRRWNAAGRKLGASADDGRARLLRAALEVLPADEHVRLVEELYRTGELRERVALLKALPLLPAPERFVEVGVEAVRSNAVALIEAVACDNPYPGRHFSEEAFNQMVLKCLFNDLALGRIQGLPDRRTAELRRMVAAYASERRAAGRSVPDDAKLVLEEN